MPPSDICNVLFTALSRRKEKEEEGKPEQTGLSTSQCSKAFLDLPHSCFSHSLSSKKVKSISGNPFTATETAFELLRNQGGEAGMERDVKTGALGKQQSNMNKAESS